MGFYWQIANYTRGTVVTVAAPTLPTTHLALVVDTSGSMRDPVAGGLWPIVINRIQDILTAQPPGSRVQLLDGDGRFILGRTGAGVTAWLDNTAGLREQIDRTLRRYNQDTVSNPVPGIYNAIRFLHAKDDPAMRMGILVLGDEFSEKPEPVLQRINELNPAGPSGERSIVINAIAFPTTIRAAGIASHTGHKFASLMRSITQEHGGTFVALPDL
jgi:hypothetical protein